MVAGKSEVDPPLSTLCTRACVKEAALRRRDGGGPACVRGGAAWRDGDDVVVPFTSKRGCLCLRADGESASGSALRLEIGGCTTGPDSCSASSSPMSTSVSRSERMLVRVDGELDGSDEERCG